MEAGKIVLDRRRFLALSSLGGIAAATAPAAPAEALELDDALRLVVDNRERGVRILGSRGEFVAARGAYYAPPVPFAHLPKHLVNALVASEDRRFFEHFGLDAQSIARALLSTVTGRRQGGSTLTQQTLKEIYLKTHSPILRKLVEEPLLAPILDHNLSKEDILYVYLNRVFFGGSAYGVEAASRVYFAKYARELSVLEAAVLVSLLPAPNRLNPHRDPERAVQRAHRVIDQMVEQERLSAAEAERAKRQRLAVAAPRSAWGGFRPQGAQVGWFARWAEQEADGLTDLRSGTRTVLTTLDARIQKAAERHLGEALERHGRRLNIEEGAVVVMRPATAPCSPWWAGATSGPRSGTTRRKRGGSPARWPSCSSISRRWSAARRRRRRSATPRSTWAAGRSGTSTTATSATSRWRPPSPVRPTRRRCGWRRATRRPSGASRDASASRPTWRARRATLRSAPGRPA